MRDPFWNNHYKAFRVQEPSKFSEYVASHYLRSEDHLIELGCGNGRDAGLLARHVSRYTGIDACPVAIESCAKSSNLGNATFQCADFTNMDFNSKGNGSGRLMVYSRFSLHSVTYAEAERLWENLEKIATSRWVFMLEARTCYDELYGVGEPVGLHEFKTDHYRRFLDPTVFLSQLAARFSVKYFEVAKGFAPFADQDPLVLRTVFGRKDTSLLKL